MTLDEYINNPEGKGASNTPYKSMYDRFYTDELDKLLLKTNGNIPYSLYKNKDDYYVLFRIPHHTYENFSYEVVFEFSTTNNSIRVLNDLRKYDVRFFSNDPSFTFTWCYAYNKQGYLIPKLRSKASVKALSQPPVVRNPSESTGYARYIYYGYLLVKLYNLLDKTKYNLSGKPFSQLLNGVKSADAKYQERLKKAEDYAKYAKGKKDVLSRSGDINTLDNTDKNKLISRVPYTSNIKPVRQVDRIHHTTTVVPKTKRSKKI